MVGAAVAVHYISERGADPVIAERRTDEIDSSVAWIQNLTPNGVAGDVVGVLVDVGSSNDDASVA
jgi:hypothetical protein